MGVDRIDYLFWGVKLECNQIDYDELEGEIDGAPDCRFHVVYDGMCGEYAMAGHIVAKSDPYSGTEFTEVDNALAKIDKAAVIEAVCKAIPEAKPASFSTYLFTHFH